MADPDLQVEVGGSHPDPEIRGASLKKNYFQPFRHQFGLKIIGGPGPSPGSATESLVVESREREKKITISVRIPPPLLGHKNDNCLFSCNRFLNFDTPSP